MFKVRLLTQKTGSAAYISHLDLMKAVQRSLTRANLPAKYSEGFNPHINLSIVVPLSTGYESLYDIVDIELTEPVEYGELVERLNGAFPPGLSAAWAKEPEMSAGNVAFCGFDIKYSSGDAGIMAKAFESNIELEKRSKRGCRIIILKDYIKSIEFVQQGDGVTCSCILNAGTDPLNPAYITTGLVQEKAMKAETAAKYIRTGIFNESMESFI